MPRSGFAVGVKGVEGCCSFYSRAQLRNRVSFCIVFCTVPCWCKRYHVYLLLLNFVQSSISEHFDVSHRLKILEIIRKIMLRATKGLMFVRLAVSV